MDGFYTYILAEFNLLVNFNGTKEFKSRFIPFYICLFISVSTKTAMCTIHFLFSSKKDLIQFLFFLIYINTIVFLFLNRIIMIKNDTYTFLYKKLV